MILAVLPDATYFPPGSAPLQHIEVASYDLWITFIKNVHEIPEALDVDKFSAALSRTLAKFRHACGRLKSFHNDIPNQRWKIQLTDSSIPLQIEDSDIPNLNQWVIQDATDLKPFLPAATPGGAFQVINSDNSLLSLKLSITRKKRRTMIGVAWHHVLGDAETLLRFMTLLSEYYQDSSPLPSSPSFQKHHFPSPTPDEIAEYTPLMPHLAQTYSFPDMNAKYALNETTVSIHAVIRRDEAERLREGVQRMIDMQDQVQNPESNIRVSVQDCITASFVTLINDLEEASATRIVRVTNAAGWRRVVNPNAPWIDSNVAGNQIYIVPTSDFDSNHLNMTKIAAQIRASLINARTPSYITKYMSVAGQYMAGAAEREEAFFFNSKQVESAGETLSVNSNFALDWHAAHFGCPGGAKFYTSGISRFYLRAFRENAGSEHGHRCIDVTLGVPESMRAEIIERMKADWTGSLRFQRIQG